MQGNNKNSLLFTQISIYEMLNEVEIRKVNLVYVYH